ncbi:MAG: NAD(P)-dependent oxidoreductase [Rhodospirillaceae bacterium]|nr:MAG: NAD(P)-dependent oxidoreductase [Rhodospirillaceae bacterium]
MEIGFIGLGAMGKAMAANLIKAGHRVRVWNRSPGPVAALREIGAEAAATVPDVFRGDLVISMLAEDGALRATLPETGVIAAAPKGLLHVNMATISVALAEELTELHRQCGLGYVAAPVFGRPDVAAAGNLNIVAAGPTDLLDRAQPIFDVLGQKTWRVGEEPIRANIVKVAGNFMIGAAIEAMGEATALTRGYGVSAADFLEIVSNTLFAAPVYKGYGALIAEQRYEPAAFKLTLGLKDIRLALAAGDGANVPLPLASLLRDNMLDAIAAGDGDRDFATLATVAQRRAGQISKA